MSFCYTLKVHSFPFTVSLNNCCVLSIKNVLNNVRILPVFSLSSKNTFAVAKTHKTVHFADVLPSWEERLQNELFCVE